MYIYMNWITIENLKYQLQVSNCQTFDICILHATDYILVQIYMYEHFGRHTFSGLRVEYLISRSIGKQLSITNV